MISWDEIEEETADAAKSAAPVQEEDDFLKGVSATDVPKACSIDQPDCEACQ